MRLILWIADVLNLFFWGLLFIAACIKEVGVEAGDRKMVTMMLPISIAIFYFHFKYMMKTRKGANNDEKK